MKKKILFVIDSLVCAGAEKSLVTLLSLIDYSKYDVDLQMFAYGRPLDELIPKEVNILKPFKYTTFLESGLMQSLNGCFRDKKIKMLKARLKYSIALRKGKFSNATKARLYWQNVSEVIENNTKEYDVAISYAQGVPTFYVAEKVSATKKYAWVNVSYRLNYEDKVFQEKYYDKYNKIVAVSDSAQDIFIGTFPKYKDSTCVIYDINDSNMINKMSNIGDTYEDKFEGIRILTIGRLAHQKGYDIALEACKILKSRGIKFRWYVLGKGQLEPEIKKYIYENNLDEEFKLLGITSNPYKYLKSRGIKFRWYVLGKGQLEPEIKKYIYENNLDEEFKLLGITSNPYKYIKDCDIYVQTSRFEGFGLAIAEARMLNVPVVTTEFDAVYNQMIDGKNGLVVKMNSTAVAEGICELINNKKLYDNIVSYLTQEKKGNTEELDKFYSLIN